MKRATILSLFSFIAIVGFSQDTYQMVYNIFQTNCATSGCHTNTTQAGGLDLEGSGGNPSNVVYNNLVDVDPQNSTAAGKGDKLVFAGDPYRSFLFRKVQANVETSGIETGEGGEMPQTGNLSEEDAEIIRQWIVFGSPQTGSVVDTSLINDYYAGNGVDGVPSPMAAPPDGEGFQIRLGPFFVDPSGEVEYYSKYPIKNDSNIEVRRVDADLGQNYSHHFITYKYTGNVGNYSDGLRLDPAHSDNEMVAAYQYTNEIHLPPGTAFFWETNTTLDLNTHYINYSNDKVLKAENYFNVYTQPEGVAKQEMKVDLYPNIYIYIPNDGQDHEFEMEIYDSLSTNEIFVWAMSSHTHQWGTDFDIFLRDINGQKGDQVYDAEYADGDPLSFFIGYDYQHPPTRYWTYPFLPIKANEGLIQRAVYNNTGSQDAWWGETSEDEMMITGLMFVDDTTGLSNAKPFGVEEASKRSRITVYPNPTAGQAVFATEFTGTWSLNITDITGRNVYNQTGIAEQRHYTDLTGLPAGVYIYHIETEGGKTFSGKLLKD